MTNNVHNHNSTKYPTKPTSQVPSPPSRDHQHNSSQTIPTITTKDEMFSVIKEIKKKIHMITIFPPAVTTITTKDQVIDVPPISLRFPPPMIQRRLQQQLNATRQFQRLQQKINSFLSSRKSKRNTNCCDFVAYSYYTNCNKRSRYWCHTQCFLHFYLLWYSNDFSNRSIQPDNSDNYNKRLTVS